MLVNVPQPYVRAVQVEGRFPNDCGAWGITAFRLRFGEGRPYQDDPDYWIKIPDDPTTLPNPPDIPRHRLHPELFVGYQRALSSSSVDSYLRKHHSSFVPVSLPLTEGWAKPVGGIIPMPSPEEVFFDQTHLVSLYPSKLAGHFGFSNSWGEEWGRRGHGYLPFEYFDKYGFEAYIGEGIDDTHVESQRSVPVPKRNGLYLLRTITRTEEGDRHYGMCIQSSPKDRRAWIFVRERRRSLDLEELYVRPEFREQGLSLVLLDSLNELRRLKKLPLHIYVPWSDSEREDIISFPLMCDLVSRLGCGFVKCPDPRAAYLAIEGCDGACMPPTPVPYPERPKGPLFKLLLAAALAVINGANRSIDGDRNESRAVALYSETDLMKIRSALDELNVYRHELIRKKRLRGLSVNEELKLVEFQEQARILADELSPIDSSKSDSIEELLALHGKPK